MNTFKIIAYKQKLRRFDIFFKCLFGFCKLILFSSFAAITFASGALLVCVSIYLYGLPKQDTSKVTRPDKATDSELKQKLISV